MVKKGSSAVQFDKYLSDMPSPKLVDLYKTMLKIRLVELKIEELYPRDEMKTPVHLCTGQEAVSAGVCANLNPTDYVFSNHRSHGHYLAKGGDLKAMIAELYCKDAGCSRGRGGSMHLVDSSVGLLGSSSIVGGCVPIATGAALSSVLQKNQRVSVAFLGDAAVEEGVFYESANFAKLKKLPVVYVCENNFYSVTSPLSNRQPDDHIFRRLSGFAIPGYQVDGNNVLEVYHMARQAIADARGGKGPSLIEARTYRWRGHAGPDTDIKLGYRTQAELDQWMARCPVENFENFLVERGVLSRGEIEAITQWLRQEIAEAFEFAQASPLPHQDEILDDVYSNT